MNEEKNNNRKDFTLTDAKLIVRYLAGPETVKEATGTFKGTQPIFGMDVWYIILRLENGMDRFIPADNLVDVDVLSAKSFEIEESESTYIG